jgi:hypothetical protein
VMEKSGTFGTVIEARIVPILAKFCSWPMIMLIEEFTFAYYFQYIPNSVYNLAMIKF